MGINAGGGSLFRQPVKVLRDRARRGSPDPMGPNDTIMLREQRKTLEAVQAELVGQLRETQLHVMPPPYLEPSFFSRGIDSVVTAVLAPAAGWTNLATFTVPGNFFGVIRGIGQDANAPAAFGDVLWRITINGSPYAPYQNIAVQLGGVLQAQLREVMITLRPNDVIIFQASNPGAVPYTVTGNLKGWYWPPIQVGSRGNWRDTITD